jgi:NADPH:quinone reductase-like Zn-dependent oxidoreductase
VLHDKRIQHGWKYGDHYMPHDIKHRELTTGRSRLQALNVLGIDAVVVPESSVLDGINVVRRMLGRTWIDANRCERGIEALRQYSTVAPVEGLERLGAAQLAVLNRAIVPFGGLLRGRLAAGETLVVNGATGAYGSAAVLLGLAMGAARVVAAGRNAAALEALVEATGPRVAAVRLTGDVAIDAAKLREVCGGGAEIAFDMVGRAGDANATLAALRSLRRGGRLLQ